MIQKNLNQPVLITPESSTYNRILLLFPSPVINTILCFPLCWSLCLLHTHWFRLSFSLTAILPVSVDTHPQLPPILHQAAESEPFCTHDYRLIHLSAYLLGHLSATAVSNCYHSPSDCIGHATSIADTSISIMASAVQFVCLSLLLSLCFHYADAEWVLFSWLLVSSSSSPSPPKNHALLITGHYCC